MSWAKHSSVALVGILSLAGGAPVGGTKVAAAASGWQEAHLTGDDVELHIDASAHAQVDHALTYRVVSGGLSVADLDGLPAGAVIDPVATVIRVGGGPGSMVGAARAALANASDEGELLTAQVQPHGEAGLRVTFDGGAKASSSSRHAPKVVGLGRGTYVVHVRYATDLDAQGALDTEGALWRLAFTSPVPAEGYDAAKVTFDLPAAPTPPRAVGLEVEAPLANLRRTPDRDVLTIARPRVARGERVTWAVKVDPRALPGTASAHLRGEPIEGPVTPPGARWKALALPVSLAALGLAFGLVSGRKATQVRRAAEAHGLSLRALVPAPGGSWFRGLLAGAAAASGLALEARGESLLGALALAVAMLLTTLLVPGLPRGEASPARARREGARGPGRWLALAKDDAFARPRLSSGVSVFANLLDGSTRLGAMTFLASVGACVAAGIALTPCGAEWPYLAALDALVLVPLFFTGTRRQLPPDATRAPSRTLRALHRGLLRDPSLRVVPWGRVPLGGTAADELRLLVLPRRSLAGLVGLELGVAFRRVLAGYEAAPEVLVRVHEGSVAEARVTALRLAPARGTPASRAFARVRAAQGRRPEERVFSFEPSVPTRRATLALARSLASALVDRRAAAAPRTPAAEPERRATVAPRLPRTPPAEAPLVPLPA